MDHPPLRVELPPAPGVRVPVSHSFPSAQRRASRHPEWLPRGVNDPEPRVPVTHPVPVVLLHGTWANSYVTFSYLAPALAQQGYRVFAFDYGSDDRIGLGRMRSVHGIRPLLESQREVAAYIDRIQEVTGAPQVDLVAHSQGVAQAKLFIADSLENDGPGNNRVRRLVGLAGNNRGSTLSGLVWPVIWLEQHGIPALSWASRWLGGALQDQAITGEAVAVMNRHGETVPGVDYTMIMTRYDQMVTPWQTQRLHPDPGTPAAAREVRNIVLQDGAPLDFSDHSAVLYNPRVRDFVLEALAEDRAAYRARHRQVSGLVAPLIGPIPPLRRGRSR